MPDQRTIQRTVHHCHRHRSSCHLDSILPVEAALVGTASAGHHSHIGLEEEDHRIDPVEGRRDRAGLVGKGWGCRRSSLGRHLLGCSMKVACRREQGQRRGGWVAGPADIGVARLGPGGPLVQCACRE